MTAPQEPGNTPAPHAPQPGERWWVPPLLAFAAAAFSRWLLAFSLFLSGEMPTGFFREATRMMKYDAEWHWYIANHGYAKVAGPLRYADLVTHYSWVSPKVLSLGLLFPGHEFFAATVINCLIFSLAAAVLARLASVSSLPWWKPVALMCCYPTAFFANTVYNEPFFMLLTFGSMLCIARGRLLASFLLDATAVTVRVNAWANVAATAFRAARDRLPARSLALAALALVLASAVQPVALWHYRGSPFANWKDLERVYWMANPQPVPFKDPAEIIMRAYSSPDLVRLDDAFAYNSFWPSVSLFAALSVLVLSWRHLPPHIRVQGLATVVGLGMLEQAISTPRYLMTFMPFYFLAGRAPPWALGAACVLMGWAQLHLVSRFLLGVWAF